MIVVACVEVGTVKGEKNSSAFDKNSTIDPYSVLEDMRKASKENPRDRLIRAVWTWLQDEKRVTGECLDLVKKANKEMDTENKWTSLKRGESVAANATIHDLRKELQQDNSWKFPAIKK